MLILLRYASLILAIILLMSMMIGFSVLIKNIFEARLQPSKKKQKAKSGDLPSDDGVRELILQGKQQEAIELYRQFTGVDEFTARDAIEDMQRELRLSIMDSEILDIMANRGKAAAIQAYQDQTGKNFDDALAYVEKIKKVKQ